MGKSITLKDYLNNKALRLLAYILIVQCAFWIGSCQQSDPPVGVYELIWNDEFSGNDVDAQNWEIQIGDGSDYGIWRWGNNESQYYRAENISVEDGKLSIKAIKEDHAGYAYTSGRLRTLDRKDFKYGKIEARIKMSNAEGLWHAFWLLPSNPDQSWPISGEIDIMEYVGNAPEEIINTVHYADQNNNHRYTGHTFEYPNDDAFHLYTLEWSPTQISWFFDSEETFVLYKSDIAIEDKWPFDDPFHILLNTAVGGNLGGSIDAEQLNSAQYMEVEYVRVYEQNFNNN